MVVPHDLLARIAPVIGSPFLGKGDRPDGWDCRGCVRWIYRTHLDVAIETYSDAYDALILTSSGRARRARLIADRLAVWRPVEAQPGAVVHLNWLGRSGHVGLMTSRTGFVHADMGVGTTLADLDDRDCPYRAVGFFVPRFVTEVIHV
ncbi:hypothetical protein KOAAANKH_00092 [Brevundimonas sp. NIBR10]|nr:hypothetical protein KOAAANKH_00092 [Brevundimonas sp. NIBR10]